MEINPITELALIRKRKLNVKRTKKNNIFAKEKGLCRNCKTDTLLEDKGVIMCGTCGLFSNSKIDMDQESYNYNDGKSDPTRTTMVDNYLIPSSNKGSIYSYNCAGGKTKNRGHNNMIRFMNNCKIMNYKDNNMLKRFNNITSICNNAGISGIIIETAKEVFYKIQKIHSPRRNKLSALMASSVIISSKRHKTKYNFNEIANSFNITKKVLMSMLNEYEHYWKEICDREEREQEVIARASLAEDNKDGEVVIEKVYKQSNIHISANYKQYFTFLDIDIKYLAKMEILDSWVREKQILIEHVPKSIIASIIYMVCNLFDINIKKNKIANVCNTSTITINKCYNKLLPYQDDIIKFIK